MTTKPCSAGFSATCSVSCAGFTDCKAAYEAPASFTGARGCRCASCGIEAGSIREGRIVMLRVVESAQTGKTLYLCYWCFGQTQTWSG